MSSDVFPPRTPPHSAFRNSAFRNWRGQRRDGRHPDSARHEHGTCSVIRQRERVAERAQDLDLLRRLHPGEVLRPLPQNFVEDLHDSRRIALARDPIDREGARQERIPDPGRADHHELPGPERRRKGRGRQSEMQVRRRDRAIESDGRAHGDLRVFEIIGGSAPSAFFTHGESGDYSRALGSSTLSSHTTQAWAWYSCRGRMAISRWRRERIASATADAAAMVVK